MPQAVNKYEDWNLGPDDLELFALFWLHLYEAAEHPPRASRESQQALELRVKGVPRSATTAVAQELALRLSEGGVPVEVSLPDPDTLVAKTKPREGNRAPFAGLGIHALAGPPFDGLLVEIRFTVADADATEPVPGLVGATLVLVGESRAGSIVVRALWVDPAFVRTEEGQETTIMWNECLPTAFDRYRRHKKAQRTLARDLFNHLLPKPVPRGFVLLGKFWLWLVFVPFGQPRLVGLLGRCVAAIGYPALMMWVVLSPNLLGELGLLGTLLFVLGIVWFCFAVPFFMLERGMLFAKHDYDRWYRRSFKTAARYAVLPPHDPRPWLSDPLVRKLIAEVTEAGFVHAGDCAEIPTKRAGTVHCTFYAPDGVTYLVLAFTFAGRSGPRRWKVWPAACITLCQTFDSDGNRFETADDVPPLETLKREDPTVRRLILPPKTHPLDMFRAHTKAATEWVSETRAAPLRHEPFDRFVERQEAISRQERKVYWRQPYSWRDHLRWYLQLDARRSPEST